MASVKSKWWYIVTHALYHNLRCLSLKSKKTKQKKNTHTHKQNTGLHWVHCALCIVTRYTNQWFLMMSLKRLKWDNWKYVWKIFRYWIWTLLICCFDWNKMRVLTITLAHTALSGSASRGHTRQSLDKIHWRQIVISCTRIFITNIFKTIQNIKYNVRSRDSKRLLNSNHNRPRFVKKNPIRVLRSTFPVWPLP